MYNTDHHDPAQYRRDRQERATYRQDIAQLVDLGYGVFPLRPNDKRPLIAGWQSIARGDKVERHVLDAYGEPYTERVDPPSVLNYWAFPPLPNVGIATGRLPFAPWSLLVLDVDPRHGGDVSLRRFPKLPETTTAVTPTDGEHYWFAHEPAQRYPNGAGRIAEGLDHRGQGGFVAAPPSLRPDGAYRWLAGPVPPWELAEVPEWLVELLELEPAHHTNHSYRRTTSTSDAWDQAEAMHAEDWLVNAVRLMADRTTEGDRNHLLYNLARKAFNDFELAPEDFTDQLADAAATAGLGSMEIEVTIRSAIERGRDDRTPIPRPVATDDEHHQMTRRQRGTRRGRR